MVGTSAANIGARLEHTLACGGMCECVGTRGTRGARVKYLTPTYDTIYEVVQRSAGILPKEWPYRGTRSGRKDERIRTK